MMKVININRLFNFMSGLTLGCLAPIMFIGNKFLYYTVFTPCVIIWYILLNYKLERVLKDEFN